MLAEVVKIYPMIKRAVMFARDFQKLHILMTMKEVDFYVWGQEHHTTCQAKICQFATKLNTLSNCFQKAYNTNDKNSTSLAVCADLSLVNIGFTTNNSFIAKLQRCWTLAWAHLSRGIHLINEISTVIKKKHNKVISKK